MSAKRSNTKRRSSRPELGAPRVDDSLSGTHLDQAQACAREFKSYAALLCGDAEWATTAIDMALRRAARKEGAWPSPDDFRAWFLGLLSEECHAVWRHRSSHLGGPKRAQPTVLAVGEHANARFREITRGWEAGERETFALLSLGYRSHDIARLLGQPIDRIVTRIRKLTEQISDHEAAV